MKKFLRTAAVMVMAAALLGGCASTDSTAENNAETTEAEATETEGTDAEAEAAEAGAALSVVVEPMTEDEFAQLDPGSVENPVIDNFSKVTITVDMTGMVPGTERNVKMPALRNLVADTGIGTYIQRRRTPLRFQRPRSLPRAYRARCRGQAPRSRALEGGFGS